MATNAEFTRTFTKHGKPAWLAPDGRIVPVIAGASDPGEPVIGDPNQPPAEPVTPQPAPEPQAQPDPGLVIPAEKPSPAEQASADLIFTREDIEKARKEEKDKLYGRLQSLEERLAETERERQERLAAEEAARKEAEAEAERRAEEEMSVRELLEKKEAEWKAELQAEREAREAAEATFNMERQFQQLEQYRQQALAANDDDIMPELHDMVSGNTPEEIDAAIALAKDKTARILANMTAAQQQVRQTQRTASVTSPAAGPMENDQAYQTVTPDDIRNMDMDTYRQKREQLLGAASNRARNQGLYG